MRLSALFIRLIVFAAAGFASFAAARTTVEIVESRSVISVQEILVDQGYEWASVIGDGLQVILEGEAPNEATRFRAISAAGEMVDASRVIDNLSVVDSAELAPPEFGIEILRNSRGVSLIGLIPAETDREMLAARITDIADGQPVTDLLEGGDYPMPDTWRPAVSYALRALELLPSSKISVKADRVLVIGISDSAEEKQSWETTLSRNTPKGVDVSVEISAPRPVISPFTTRFIIDDAGPHFDACAANNEEARQAILDAAIAAGVTGDVDCTLALGSPSREWGKAVTLAIAAIDDIGGGTVTIADTDVTFIAPLGTGQGTFDDVVGILENSLPDAFALIAQRPVRAETTPEGGARFTATRSPEGQIQLRGRVPDAVTNTVAENFAVAKFGQQQITMGTRVSDGLPSGWAVRVLAGIEALSELSNGSVVVLPETIQIKGNTGNKDASANISRLMIEKLGQTAEFEIDVAYVEQLDPIAGLPSPEECVEQIGIVTENRKITFDPGSAQISGSAQVVVDDIAEILRRCGNLRIQIAGYTDSQGREEMNQQLSQQRAEAVLSALRARRVPVSTFDAIGYGESDPIADNDTEVGREANRRIEFNLIVPAPVVEEESTLDALAEEAQVVEETPASEETVSE